MSRYDQAEVPPPDWLHNRVLDGVQFMRALGLPGTPAAEVVKLTFTAWVFAIWDNGALAWSEQQDSARLYRAFQTAAASATRWPTPKEVLQAMQPRQALAALPYHAAPPTEAQRQALREARRRLTDHLTTLPATSAGKASAP